MITPDSPQLIELLATRLEACIAEILQATSDISPGSMPEFKAGIDISRYVSEAELRLIWDHVYEWTQTQDRIFPTSRIFLINGSARRLECKVSLVPRP